jgi:hypothetical protein
MEQATDNEPSLKRTVAIARTAGLRLGFDKHI